MIVRKLFFLVTFSLSLFYSNLAYGYIGPGLGLGSLLIALGTVGAILLALISLLYYPLKKLFINLFKNKNKSKKKN
tara:strand:+ start:218 stop:445 length:228 start_codon:yes stop_codon:yes gene_type:complete